MNQDTNESAAPQAVSQLTPEAIPAIIAHNDGKGLDPSGAAPLSTLADALRAALERLQDIETDNGIQSPYTIETITRALASASLQGGK